MKSNKLLKYLLIIAGVLIVFAIIGKKSGCIGKVKATKVSIEKAERRKIVEIITAMVKSSPKQK